MVDEGEGHTSVAEWRAGHERFWHGEEMRAALDDPEFTVHDGTPTVLERFRLRTDLRPAARGPVDDHHSSLTTPRHVVTGGRKRPDA